jgi:hypothetical protein
VRPPTPRQHVQSGQQSRIPELLVQIAVEVRSFHGAAFFRRSRISSGIIEDHRRKSTGLGGISATATTDSVKLTSLIRAILQQIEGEATSRFLSF